MPTLYLNNLKAEINICYTQCMPLEIIHSIVLILTIAMTFVFAKTPLIEYDIQIIALLFIALFIIRKWYLPSHPRSHLLESVIFTFVAVVSVLTTGGLTSPLFFLIFFLIFAHSILMEPIIAVISSVTIMLFFFIHSPSGTPLQTLLPLIALPFITPFALFLGQQIIENERLKRQEVKVQEDHSLFLYLVVKNHLKNIHHAVDNFMGDRELSEIKHQATRLETLIERLETESKKP